MALRRREQNITVRHEVVAAHSNIKGFSVGISEKRISVEMEYGNIVDGKFVAVAQKTHIIRDKPQTFAAIEKNETVVGGRLVLPYTPVANLRVESVSGQVYYEGVDYTRNGNMINVITMPEGLQVKTSYSYEAPATFDFSNIAAGAVNGTQNLYGNIKAALWGKLLDLGLEEGTVE